MAVLTNESEVSMKTPRLVVAQQDRLVLMLFTMTVTPSLCHQAALEAAASVSAADLNIPDK